jgi:TetR/AcrR family transcriptional repressor of mexJK operon
MRKSAVTDKNIAALEKAGKSTNTATRPRGRPRDPELRERIMNAALAHFMEFGLDGASMERIAESAGTSKVTMYKYFSSKEDLFNAIANESRTMAFDLNIEGLDVKDPMTSLTRIGNDYLAMITDPSIALHMRLLSGQVTKNPQLIALFFDTGPKKVHQSVSRFLKRLHEQGEVSIENTELAAEQFLGMLKGNEHLRVFLGLPGRSAAKRNEYIRSCAAAFLRTWGKQRM